MPLSYQPHLAPRRRIALGCVALAFYLLCALALNAARGAFGEGFGSFDDEPSHLVTGLLFRDYLTAGCPGSPLAFAQEYYLHYPKVGIGQWPPGYYVAEALWMLVAGDNQTSLLVFASALAALAASAVYFLLRAHVGEGSALLAGAIFLTLPLVQIFSAALMTEMALALWCTLAVWQLGLYLDTQRRGALIGFALASIAAIMTKGNGIALALVPLGAAALCGRLDALRRRPLWIAGLAIGAACAPWYALTLDIPAGTWGGGAAPSLAYAAESLKLYARNLLDLGGPALIAGAICAVVLRPGERGQRGVLAALEAWFVAWLLLHLVVPSSIEARHLVLVAPALVALAILGVTELGARLRRHGLAVRSAPAVCFILGIAAHTALPPKPNGGYGAAAERVLADPRFADAVLLVASDSIGEGLLIGEIALREERPGHYVLRGSKVLGRSTWLGEQYEPRFASADAMLAYLLEVPVGVIAFDHALRPKQRFGHHDVLLELLQTRTDRFERFATFDVRRDGERRAGALELYRLRADDLRPKRPLDLHSILGGEPPRRFAPSD